MKNGYANGGMQRKMEEKLKIIMGRLPATRKEFEEYIQILKQCELEFAQLCQKIEADLEYVSGMKSSIEELTKRSESLLNKNNHLEETIKTMVPFTKENLMQIHREMRSEIDVLQYQNIANNQRIEREKNEMNERLRKLSNDNYNLQNRINNLEKQVHKNDMAAFVRNKK